MKELPKFCSPARIYLVLGLISLVLQTGLGVLALARGELGAETTALTVVALGLSFLFTVGYAAALDKFCTWGWSPLSWLLVLGPLLVSILSTLRAVF